MRWLEDLVDDGLPTPERVGWGFTVMYWAAGLAVVIFIVNFARTYLGLGR